MTELPASAGSEGYAACDDEAKDMQLATTKRGADLHRPLGTHEVQNALRGRGGAAE